jgi:hypothetical protein
MIIRDSLRCETCGTLHVVRIGMGQEESQEHRFPCRNCREDIALALVVDYENMRSHVVFKETAAYTPEEPGAEIVNLDANFLIPDDLQGVDGVIPRFDQVQALAKASVCDAPRLPKGRITQRNGNCCAEPGIFTAAGRSRFPVPASSKVLRRPTTRMTLLTACRIGFGDFVSGLSGPGFGEACVEAMNFMIPLRDTPGTRRASRICLSTTARQWLPGVRLNISRS